MNIGELKQEIMNLAFEEQSSMKEYADIVLNAINRSIGIICSTVRPVLSKVEIEQAETVSAQYVRYNMSELTTNFMGLNNITLETPEERYIESVPYTMEGRSIVLLRGSDLGKFTIWYKRKPARITAETDEKTELELDYDLHVLVPLLSSYYVWLDDDERKATYFKNDYEDLKTQILSATTEKPVAVIEGGMGW